MPMFSFRQIVAVTNKSNQKQTMSFQHLLLQAAGAPAQGGGGGLLGGSGMSSFLMIGLVVIVFYFFPKSSRTHGLLFLRFLSKLRIEHMPRQIEHLLHLFVSQYTLLSFSEILIAPAGQLTIQKGDAQNL